MSLISATGSPINCGTFVGLTAPTWIFDKKYIASSRFVLRVTPILRTYSPSSTTDIVVQDRNIKQINTEILINDYLAVINYLIPNFELNDITITSSNTSILLSPVNNIAQSFAAGPVVLKAETPSGEFSSVALTVQYVPGTQTYTFQSYVSNSAARHAADAIDTRIAGKNAEIAKPIYSTQNHTSAIYVRNTNCWAADLDLTCISPWNSTDGNRMAGTLISPRHVLFVEHFDFHPSVGATIRFVTTNNTVISRTITALATHPDYVPFYPDITIGVLNSDVPPSISFAKILPQNWETYFPSMSNPPFEYDPLGRIPALSLDQEEKALVSEWAAIRYATPPRNLFLSPVNEQRLAFFENLILGDSGNPAFLIINNELVILNTWTYGNAGSGTSIVDHKNAINAMMTTLGGGYQVTEVDLSSFPAY